MFVALGVVTDGGHDPDNDVTLVVWTNLTVSPDGATTANAMLPKVLDEIYTGLYF